MSVGDEHLLQNSGLGDLIEEFRPAKASIVAGIIISIMLFAGEQPAFVVEAIREAYLADWRLPLQNDFRWSWLEVGGVSAGGVALAVGGVFLVRYMRRLASRGVAVCENGFRYCSRGVVENVQWAQVSRVREEILPERGPTLGGPVKLLIQIMVTSESVRYVVITQSGKRFEFDGNSIRAIERFRKLLLAQSIRHSFPWEYVQVPG